MINESVLLRCNPLDRFSKRLHPLFVGTDLIPGLRKEPLRQTLWVWRVELYYRSSTTPVSPLTLTLSPVFITSVGFRSVWSTEGILTL